MRDLIERLRNFEGSDELGNGDFSLLHEAAAALEAARRNAGMLAPPEGYALISVEVLRAWGKLDELRECCRYPKHATSQPAAVDGAIDKARFEKAPCYLCGYNGPGYYQPDTHPCAAKYHAAQQQEVPRG